MDYKRVFITLSFVYAVAINFVQANATYICMHILKTYCCNIKYTAFGQTKCLPGEGIYVCVYTYMSTFTCTCVYVCVYIPIYNLSTRKKHFLLFMRP